MPKLTSIKKFFQPKLELVRGTRFVSFLFIALSVMIAASILWAANLYYNIDTGEVVMEEIQRVTGIIRATAGLIVAGTASQNPAAGVTLEVATGTVSLSGAEQVLRFTGGTSYYTGFRATTTMTTTTAYYLPPRYADAADYVLSWQTGNQLQWRDVTAIGGIGDITQVGNVTSSAAFAGDDTGNTLYFEGSAVDTNEIALTAQNPGADYTITLPAQTGTVGLLSASLTAGGVMFATDTYTMGQDAVNLFWDNTNKWLGIGTSTPAYPLDVKGAIRTGIAGTSGQFRIYSEQGATDYEVIFNPTSTMTANTTYYLPPNVGSNNYVLTTDGTGVLTWRSVTGAGGIDTYGTPAGGQVTYFYDSDTVTGSSNFTWATSTNTLTIAGTLIATTYTSDATTTIQSASGYPIFLDPASGKITLGPSDWIETSAGYQIGKSGTQVLREMIPIMGFDLPAQTASTSFVKISRTIERYPFAETASGTDRVHKLVFRYAASTTGSWHPEFRVKDETAATYSTTSLSNWESNSLDDGVTFIATTTFPTYQSDTDWWVEIRNSTSSAAIRAFEIFLAAYDQIN